MYQTILVSSFLHLSKGLECISSSKVWVGHLKKGQSAINDSVFATLWKRIILLATQWEWQSTSLISISSKDVLGTRMDAALL